MASRLMGFRIKPSSQIDVRGESEKRQMVHIGIIHKVLKML